MQLCAEYQTLGHPIPVQLMTADQFTAYCASITRIEPDYVESSLSTIQKFVHLYDPTSATIPLYLKFTVTTGTRLLENHMNGAVDNRWNYRHEPIQIAKQILHLTIPAVGSSVGISQDTPNAQRLTKLSRKFHPDKILRQYHPVYEPFLNRAFTVLTIAFNIIEYDEDMPDLVDSDDDDPHYSGPSAPHFDEEEAIVLSNPSRFTSPNHHFSMSMIRLIHHSSNMSLNILPESNAFPGADIPDPFSALNTPMDDKTRAKKIATGKKILHDFRMTRKITLNDGGTQTDTPAQDTDSSVLKQKLE